VCVHSCRLANALVYLDMGGWKGLIGAALINKAVDDACRARALFTIADDSVVAAHTGAARAWGRQREGVARRCRVQRKRGAAHDVQAWGLGAE